MPKRELSLEGYVCRSFFRPEPLVLVSTISPDGVANVAPKTHVTPAGLHNYWAFACCPSHHTYQNVVAQGEFVINIPGPELMERIALSARRFSPGADEITASGLTPSPSKLVSVPSIAECRVHLECRKTQIVDDLGGESLILGRVVAATVDEEFLGTDPGVLRDRPLLVYVYPDHYATLKDVEPFTFPPDYKA